MTQPVPEPPVYAEPSGALPAKLGQLLAQYDDIKAKADAAKTELDLLTKAIKAEATGALVQPDGTPWPAYVFDTPDLAKPVKLTWTVSQTFDTKGFRAANPELAEAWTKPSGTWRLERKR